MSGRTRVVAHWLLRLLAFMVLAALFAASIRSQLPVIATIAFGVSTALALGALSAQEREVPLSELRWLLPPVFAICVAATVVSISDAVADSIGFAGLVGALYTVVRLANMVRRAGAASPRVTAWVTWASLVLFGLALVPFVWMRLIAGLLCMVTAALAIEFRSEHPPRIVTGHRLRSGMIGTAVIVVSWLVVSGFGASPTAATWLVIVLGALTALLVTSNDAPALVAVVLIAAVWSTLPREASFPPGQAARAGEPYVAVLGDSYISGEGAEEFFAGTNTTGSDGNECRRAPTAWPMRLNPVDERVTGDEIGVPRRVAFLACSGAVTADILGVEGGGKRQPVQLDLLRRTIEVAGPPQFLVVSIGGNDSQFADVVVACIAPGNCTDYVDEVRNSRMPALEERLVHTYVTIRQTVGVDVPVLVSAYPQPVYTQDLDDPTSPPRDCSAVALSRDDIDAVNGFATRLDETIAAAADRAGVTVIDALPGALAANALQLCDPHNRPGLNFADLNPKAGDLWSSLNPLNWTHNFVHPNAAGHRALTSAALDWMVTNPTVWAPDATVPPMPADADAIAATLPPLPPETSPGASVRDGIASSMDQALIVLAFTTAGWWLLLMALNRRPDVTTTDGTPAARSVSLLEKLAGLFITTVPPAGPPSPTAL